MLQQQTYMPSAFTVVPTEVGTQTKPSAKGYFWIPDSSGMTTEGWMLSLVSCLLLTTFYSGLWIAAYCLLPTANCLLTMPYAPCLTPYALLFCILSPGY